MPAKDQSAPNHLDRLIAFLRSHFGDVQYLSTEELAEEAQASPMLPETETLDEHSDEKPKLEFGDEQVSAETRDEEYAGQQKQAAAPGGPVVRIRMDEHVADVGVNDLAVHTDNEAAQRRIESVLQVALRTVTSLAPIQPGSQWASTNGSQRIAVKAEV